MATKEAVKHTPGPWYASGPLDDRIIGYTYEDADGNRHAGTICVVDCNRGLLNEANARLIAAAPEMLDALKEATDWVEGLWARGVDSKDELDRAERFVSATRNLIAKAEGR